MASYRPKINTVGGTEHESFLIGQSNTALFLKRRGRIEILSNDHGAYNNMTPQIFALYVTCLLLGTMGKLHLSCFFLLSLYHCFQYFGFVHTLCMT